MENKWDDLWSIVRDDFNDLSPSQRHKYRLMHRLFKKYGLSGTGFDIGCGNGATLCFLSTYCSQLYGIDSSSVAIRKTQQRLPQAVLFQNNIMTFDPADREQCDVVTCVNVLEEVEDTNRVLSLMESLVKPGGHVCIVTQHSEKYRSKYDDFAGNIKRFELSDLTHRIRSTGFFIRSLKTWGFPLYTLYYSLTKLRNPRKVWSQRERGAAILSSIIYKILILDDLFDWCNRGRIIVALCQKTKAR